MIKSCKDCKTKCCKTGPGPYKTYKVETYLGRFETAEGYNTKCENLMSNGNCKLWGTPRLPEECRIHVCTVRQFSKDELKKINQVTDFECDNCSSEWTRYLGKRNGNFHYLCEICDHRWKYTESTVRQGKKIEGKHKKRMKTYNFEKK